MAGWLGKSIAALCLALLCANANAYDQPEHSGYQYNSSIQAFGRIFINSQDQLVVVTGKGTYVYGRNNQLLRTVTGNERQVVGVSRDKDGNMYFRDDRYIKKVAKNPKSESYRIDIPKNATYLGRDEQENYYFIAPRIFFDLEQLTSENSSLTFELAEKEQEQLAYQFNQDPIYSDIADYTNDITELRRQKMEYLYDIDRYGYIADYRWKRLANFGEKILMDEKIKLEEELNNIYEAILERKERIYSEIDERLFEMRVTMAEKRFERQVNLSILQTEIAQIKLRQTEIAAQIKQDRAQQFVLLILDQNELAISVLVLERPPASEGPPLYECAGVKLGSDGKVYGFLDEKVYIYNERGELLNRFGRFGTHPGEIGQIYDLAADSQGNIYVADGLNSKIHIFLAP